MQRPNGVQSNCGYDDGGRLLSVQHSDWLDWVLAFACTLDPAGNRTTLETVLGGVSDSTSYTYDDGDRILTVDGVPYAYDNRGNLTSDGTWTYTYRCDGLSSGTGFCAWA